MTGLAATFRQLYSGEAHFERKLEAAEELVAALVPDSHAAAPPTDGGALPPLVRTHYLCSLVEWSCGALTKARGTATGKKGKKAQTGDDAGGAGKHAQVQPRCWAVLTAVLGSGDVAASQPLPVALLGAATAVLQALGEGQQQAEQGELLAQLALLLRLLGDKFATTFRPGIDHAAAAAEAALSAHAAAGRGAAAWQPVAVAAVHLLLAAASGHPSQRKVWDAGVPRLLPQLARAAFPADATAAGGELASSCRMVLEAVVFNQQHVPALAAAAAAEMAAALAEAGVSSGAAAAVGAAEAAMEVDGVEEAAAAEDGTAASGVGKTPKQPQGSGGYAAQLFVALRRQVAASELPLALLPWMVGRYCSALRQHRRTLQMEAELTSQASRRGQQQWHEEGEEGAEDGSAGAGSQHRPAAGGGGDGLSVSADFHFWLALLRCLLPHVEQLAAGARPEQLAEAVSGVALLAGALRSQQLYRPTQDPAGQQRALLQLLADGALALAQQAQAEAAGAAGGVTPAALGVVQGILEVEHRVIQRQLPLLWPLLLWSPAASAGTDGGVAAAVACSLVAAFAELRQLAVLLQSLTAALLQRSGGAQAAEAAAAAVLGSSQLQAALAAAVRQLPSGQVPMLLRLAAGVVPQLGGSDTGSQLLVADLCCRCLASLRVDLTTAATAATATAALVDALAPPLLPLLAAGGSGKVQGKARQKGLLPALLALYRQALLVHARCAALHPEVVPLPGQHELPAAGGSSVGSNSYFAPLLQQGRSSSEVPELPELLQAATSSDAQGLHLVLLQAAQQRVHVLHQRQRYLTRTCPVTLLPAPGGEADSQQTIAQERPPQQSELELEATERELRKLAGAIVAAAVDAPAAADAEAVVQLAVGALPALQDWAPSAQLQQLLQSCLRQAAGDGKQRLSRRLLLDGELLEQQQLAALLPAAAAAGLAASLSAAFGGASSGAAQEEGTAPQKSKKARKSSSCAEGLAAGSSHLEALLQQLEQLAKGKAPKSSIWAAAVEGSAASIAALAVGGDAGGSKKKRKRGDAPAAVVAGLEAVRQQAQLLAQLPLKHLQTDAAAAMAAVALASLLGCWEGALQQRYAADALPATTACLELLASVGSTGMSDQVLQVLPTALHAALTAAGSAASPDLPDQVAEAAKHGSRVMQAACAARIAAFDEAAAQQLGQQLSQLPQGQQQWAAAVLVHGCLAAVLAAVKPGGRGCKAAADLMCGAADCSSEQPDAVATALGRAAAELEAAVAALLPAAAQTAAEASGSMQPDALAGSLYGSAALLLRLHCSNGPAAEALAQGSSGSIATMASGLQAAAALLERPAAEQAGDAALLSRPLLEYAAACCAVTGRMRPAASNRHYASLLALLLHQLALQPLAADGAVPPTRQTVPFAAAFPAAAAAVAADRQPSSGSSAARPLVLEALRELVAGSSSQQLVLPLRYVEAALPAAAAPGGSQAMMLPLCELLLVLLQAAGGDQQQRLLGQHGARIAALLTGLASSAAYMRGQPQQAQQPVPSLQQLAADILAAGESGSGSHAEAASAPACPAVAAAAAPGAPPTAAEVAALCTAQRTLESLAARPKLFTLPPAAASSMLAAVSALWSAYANIPGAAGAALPGFCFRLDTASSAGLFASSCHLLLAMLRHRQQELRRCLPLVLQALRALLRFLVAAELSARLQRAAGAPAEGEREQQWRVKCAELLADVQADLAALKEAGIGRYCPQVLADYVVLAAAPPSAKSKALLAFSSPAATQQRASGSASAAAAAGAAAAEEDVLSGEPLGPEVAAALRRGAYTLFSACSPGEVQFLYASLGSSGGQRGGGGAVASWRGALAGLKAGFEHNHKYTGKV